MQIARKPNETTLSFYKRLKEGVADGTYDLEKSEIYMLLYGESVSADHARKCLKILDLSLEADESVLVMHDHDAETEIDIPSKTTVEIHKDGSQSRSALIRMTEADSKDAVFLLKAHGYDPGFWELTGARSNIWNAYSKEDGIMELYSSKVTVRPLKNSSVYAEIDAFLEAREFKNPRQCVVPTNYDPSGEILEINLPDLHAGLFSWEEETEENYDTDVMKTRFLKCVCDIIERSRGRKFERIIFTTLGDLLHTDNDNQTTARGTFQQVDGRIAKAFSIALDALIDAIELLGGFAPVEIIYVAGNHDRTLGYALMKAVEKAFRDDGNITLDVSHNPRKFRRFENVLIGWLHGDCAKNNISEWLQVEGRKDYGASLFAEVHAGHYHHQQTLEKSGMIVRFLPTICASSSWEHQKGYSKNVKTVVSFVWNKVTGLREMWFSNI